MSGEAKALLLDLSQAQHVAIAPHELVELAHAEELFDVPLAPTHCNQLFAWKDRLIPVVDLSRMLGIEEPASEGNLSLVAVVAYQPTPGKGLDYGCLKLATHPRLVSVRDADAAPMPQSSTSWKSLAISCFGCGEGRTAPVLNLAQLFAQPVVAPTWFRPNRVSLRRYAEG